MKAKHLLIVGVITLAGCWVWEGDNPPTDLDEESALTIAPTDPDILADNSIPSLPVIEPIVIPPLIPPDPIPQPPPLTPVIPQDPAIPPETGAANIQVAQIEQQHPRFFRGRQYSEQAPIVISMLGKTTSNTLEIAIPKPPEELHGCNQAVILGEHIPIVNETYRYNNNWWLIASTNGLGTYSPDTPVYFLWARRISEKEVGAVATGIGTNLIDIKDPIDAKIDTGYKVLPYQWISRIDFFNYFPIMPDESCNAGK